MDRWLDNPAWKALTGRQSHLGRVHLGAARYDPEICPFAGFADLEEGRKGLSSLGDIVAPGEVVALPGVEEVPDWRPFEVLDRLQVRQMICGEPVAEGSATLATLKAPDAAEMVDLADRTRPGPFAHRTIEMGTYVGVRQGGELVAMGGERMRGPGHSEISGICSDERFRGRGHAEIIVRHLCHVIQDRGERPFLHVVVGSPSESTATALYERIGFVERRVLPFAVIRRLAS
jgi:ribosomal protein S18 acetylase RimI-like enzyme